MRRFYTLVVCAVLFSLSLSASAIEPSTEDIVAKTADGEEVILHPNGYWEYVDKKKAEVARVKVEAMRVKKVALRALEPAFLALGVVLPMMTLHSSRALAAVRAGSK